MNTRRHFSPEFKARLGQPSLREEQSINQLAAEHGLHPNQLYRWRDQALAGLPSWFSDHAAQATGWTVSRPVGKWIAQAQPTIAPRAPLNGRAWVFPTR